jgi:hypothetical protein
MAQRNTTIEIDREVARLGKILAAEQGVTLKYIVETAMVAYLTRWPKGTVPKKEKGPLSSK